MKEEIRPKFLGSLYNKGQSFAGATWDKDYISPTLTTMQGGNREPMIVEIVRLENDREYNLQCK